jgi:hypothetical protein
MLDGCPLAVTAQLEASQVELTVLHNRNVHSRSHAYASAYKLDAGRIPRLGQRSLPRKRHGPDGSHRDAGQPRSSLAPSSACHERNSPIPPLSSMASSKPGRLPAPASSPIPSPSWPTQRKLSGRSLNSGISLAPMLSTPPQARSSPSTFLPPSALWTNHGNQDICEAPTPPSAATASNLRTRPTTSSWPKSSHKLLGPNASLSVGQSYKAFLHSKALSHPC